VHSIPLYACTPKSPIRNTIYNSQYSHKSQGTRHKGKPWTVPSWASWTWSGPSLLTPAMWSSCCPAAISSRNTSPVLFFSGHLLRNQFGNKINAMTVDRNITGRLQPVGPSCKARGHRPGGVRLPTFMHSFRRVCRSTTASRRCLEDHAPPSPFSARDAVPPSP